MRANLRFPNAPGEEVFEDTCLPGVKLFTTLCLIWRAVSLTGVKLFNTLCMICKAASLTSPLMDLEAVDNSNEFESSPWASVPIDVDCGTIKDFFGVLTSGLYLGFEPVSSICGADIGMIDSLNSDLETMSHDAEDKGRTCLDDVLIDSTRQTASSKLFEREDPTSSSNDCPYSEDP